MFSKSNKGTTRKGEADSPQRRELPPSIISNDLRIIGDLSSEGEIQVDGKIDGDIRTKTLLVGETAIVKGEIVAESVVVHGTIEGQIKAFSVTLAKSAHVVGNILHENLSIEKGAFLKGHCNRMAERKEPEPKVNVVSGETGAAAKGEGAAAAIASKGSKNAKRVAGA